MKNVLQFSNMCRHTLPTCRPRPPCCGGVMCIFRRYIMVDIATIAPPWRWCFLCYNSALCHIGGYFPFIAPHARAHGRGSCSHSHTHFTPPDHRFHPICALTQPSQSLNKRGFLFPERLEESLHAKMWTFSRYLHF